MQALNTFAAGDSNYIAKLNQDNAAIKAAIDALEALIGRLDQHPGRGRAQGIEVYL